MSQDSTNSRQAPKQLSSSTAQNSPHSGLLNQSELSFDHSQSSASVNQVLRSLLGEQAEDIATPIQKNYLLNASITNQSYLPFVEDFSLTLQSELALSTEKLLKLNRTRREALVAHLESLLEKKSGCITKKTTSATRDSEEELREWLSQPKSSQHHAALRSYFGEVAWYTLAQIILLKSWSDRKIRIWKEDELKQINWTLSSALKPHIAHNREPWQITRPNLYSWYTPSPGFQKRLWETLDRWNLSDDGFPLLQTLVSQQLSEIGVSLYDPRLFEVLYRESSAFGLTLASSPQQTQSGVLNRIKFAYTPTLREGSLVQLSPRGLHWLGCESNPFLLLIAELVQLWWGPCNPPLWIPNFGTEIQTRDQLHMDWSPAKKSLHDQIGEIGACDLSIVTEESPTRINAKSIEASLARAEIQKSLEKQGESKHPLISQQTSLGTLQTAIALSKLRPGGLLWWAREEPLTASEGHSVLSYLFEKGTLIAEWNFSQLQHSLQGTKLPFPKYLYLFKRDPIALSRWSNHPMRITVQGSLRSYIELTSLLDDCITSLSKNHDQDQSSVQKTNWKIFLHKSPSSQKDWLDKWPQVSDETLIAEAESMKLVGIPLGQLTTIRQGAMRQGQGFFIWPDLCDKSDRLLKIAAFDADSEELKKAQKKNLVFSILCSETSWLAPLRHYLESKQVHRYLEIRCDRKQERWVFDEALLRTLPIPRDLVVALSSANQLSQHLPSQLEEIISELSFSPEMAMRNFTTQMSTEEKRSYKWTFFLETSKELNRYTQTHRPIIELMSSPGKLNWAKLINLLPQNEFISPTLHPQVRNSGSLPSHLPISKWERVKQPLPGIIFLTDGGFHLHLGFESTLLLDLITNQLEGLQHPTWSELSSHLRLPRNLDWWKITIEEILKAHEAHRKRLDTLKNTLTQLLNLC